MRVADYTPGWLVSSNYAKSLCEGSVEFQFASTVVRGYIVSMTAKLFSRILTLVLVPLMFGFLMTGCETDKSSTVVNWDSRVGNYTFDQATAELGTPGRTEKLDDGGKRVEWLTRKNAKSPITQSIGSGYQAGGLDESVGQNVALRPSDEYLLLTFDAGGKLVKWSKVYH